MRLAKLRKPSPCLLHILAIARCFQPHILSLPPFAQLIRCAQPQSRTLAGNSRRIGGSESALLSETLIVFLALRSFCEVAGAFAAPRELNDRDYALDVFSRSFDAAGLKERCQMGCAF